MSSLLVRGHFLDMISWFKKFVYFLLSGLSVIYTSIFAQVCFRGKKNIVVNSENKALTYLLTLKESILKHVLAKCPTALSISIKSYLLFLKHEPEANMTFKSKVTNKMGESSVVVIQEYTRIVYQLLHKGIFS